MTAMAMHIKNTFFIHQLMMAFTIGRGASPVSAAHGACPPSVVGDSLVYQAHTLWVAHSVLTAHSR